MASDDASMADIERMLRTRLASPRPGLSAQRAMAPRPRVDWPRGELPQDHRSAGVLLLVYPRPVAAHLVLTVRRGDLPQHAGQISLPGGAIDPGESTASAALREAQEEIGLAPGAARLLGALSPLAVPVSRFVLHPWIGIADATPALTANALEVERMLEVALEDLADPDNAAVECRRRGDQDVLVPYFRVEDVKVWGATAMVLAEFLALLGRTPDPWKGGR
jgi:8-oxo-dGTP pyrophosphatase MutT (NUDIX family)